MAPAAAAADAPAVGDNGVADLAGGGGGAGKVAALVDDAAADPGADEHADEGVLPFAGAEALLAQGSDLQIVADAHGQPQLIAQPLRQRHVDEAGQIRTAEQHAARAIDHPGDAETAGCDVDTLLGAPRLGQGVLAHVYYAL